MGKKLFRKRLIKFPLKVLVYYLLATLVMFTISPWGWEVPNNFTFYLFNTSVIIALILGYKRAISSYKYMPSKAIDKSKWINRSIIIGLIAIYPRFLIYHGVSYMSVGNIINKVIIGISTPAEAYLEKSLGNTNYNTLSNPISLLNFLSVPFMYFIIFTGFYFWAKLSKWQKIGYTIILASHVLLYLSIGTNKGLFDLVIVFPFLLIAQNPKILSFTKNQFTLKRIILVTLSTFLIFTAISFFARGNKERKSDYFYTNTATNKYLDKDAAVLKIIPTSLQDTYISLDSYLTQGYYALGLALNMEFKPTYGFGNSFFFTSLGEKVVGKNTIANRTYQHRIEEKHGYSHYGKWHSFYVWLANDVSFFLVPLVVYFIGYYFTTSWLDILLHKNIFAIVIFSLLLIMIFYFPANNQVLGFQGSALTLLFFFYLWQKSRNKTKRLIW